MFKERNDVQTSLQNDCSISLGQKNSSAFLNGSLFFIEWVRSNLFTTFNTTFKKGLTNVESRVYKQTALFLIILDLQVSDEFFSEI